MELNCHRCKKVWEYKGNIKPNKDYPQYVSCPRCKTSIRVQETKEE